MRVSVNGQTYPRWLPHPLSMVVAVVAGAMFGIIEGARDGRVKRKQSEVWDQANISDTVESLGSDVAGTNQANGTTANSNLPL